MDPAIDAAKSTNTSGRPRRVVIPIIAGLGNSLMAMPMVRQLKQAWPDAKITILARNPSMGESLKRMPEVDEVLYTYVGLKALFRAVKFSRQRRPDLYLIPFPSNRWHYSLLALTSGAKRRILHSYPAGYWRAMHFIGTRTPAVRGIHDVIQNLRLLKLIGIQPDESEAPRFLVNDADRARAGELLAGAAPAGASSTQSIALPADFIAIHAGSGSYTVIARAKRWPPQKYAELIDRMRREFGKPILLIEGPDETGVADAIVKHLPADSGTPSRAGLFLLKLNGPLGETAAVLERAILYVGSDSGVAHLASAVGKRAVTIFAPADPERVCPHGSRDLVVQTPNTCSPCFTYPFETPYTDSKCREPFCIEQVTVDRVVQTVRRALGAPSVGPITELTVKGSA